MKILKNKEVQLSIGILAVLIIVFGAVSMYIVGSYTKALNKAQIRQNIAVIGAVAKIYPHAEAEIVKNYTKSFQGDYEYGKSLMKKYNYDENMSVDKNYMIQGDLLNLNTRFQIIISIFAIVLLAFLILSLDRIFSKIRSISVSAEAVVEGNYDPINGDREEGDMGALIYQFNSMTERLSDNVQALKNEKLFLKRLITDISHQLKTPLASLVMFNDIMKNDTSLTEKDRTTFVMESKNQLDRMEWLIKNMLKMAKLEAGVVDFEKEESFIGDTIEKSITGLKYIADEKNVNIYIDGSDATKIMYDKSWMTEAFSNVIKNCIEHCGNGGEIHINWEENNVFVQIEIRDNGSGIAKQELPKIFDRFYKGPNSCNPTNIGIGLYITKSIIEGQGGSIYAVSKEGQGTRFIIRLMKLV